MMPCRLWMSALIPLLLAVQANANQAHEILETTGVRGGLIVHIGCGEGKLTAALRASGRFIVHGLDTDAANVEAARRHIKSLGLYGPVSVKNGGGRLPFTWTTLVNSCPTRRDCRWKNSCACGAERCGVIGARRA